MSPDLLSACRSIVTNGVILVSGSVISHRVHIVFAHSANTHDHQNPPLHLASLQPVMETPFSCHDSEVTNPSLQVQLLAFPDEILLAVLWFMPSRDLFTLATLSKKLHHLALAVYLQLHGLPQDVSGDLVLDSRSLEGLPGLRIALSDLTFRHVTCTFPTKQDAFLAGITSLRAILKRCTRLEEVTLEFKPIAAVDHIQELDPLSWSQPLQCLMTTIASTGCTSVVLRGGLTSQAWLQSHVPPSAPPPSPVLPTTFLSKMRITGTIAKKLRTLSRRHPHHPPLCTSEPTVEEPITSSIQNLSVTSAMFFFRIAHEWTIRTLNTAPIETLSLCNIAYHDPGDWHIILSALTMPSLQHLTIKSCSITFHTLSELLNRHPSLRTLTIDNLFENGGGDAWYPLGPETHAPSLTALTAPVRYIPQFLSCDRIAPNLTALTILAADVHRTGVPEFARVWWHALDRVAERVQRCVLALDITLPYYEGFRHLLIAEDSALPYIGRMERLFVRPGACGEYLKRRNWRRFREWLECFPVLGELAIVDGEGENGVLGDEEERRAFVHEMMPVFVKIAKVRLDDQELW